MIGPGPVGSAQETAPADIDFGQIITGRVKGAQRVLLYGTSGIGKTTTSSLCPNPIFIDLEQGSYELDVPRILVSSHDQLVGVITSAVLDDFETIVLDSASRAQDLAREHVLESDVEKRVLEDYGWGKGYQLLFHEMALLLSHLDRHVENGRNVVVIAHDTTERVHNPQGTDFLRYSPDLQTARNANVRNHFVQWAGHVVFLAYDRVVEPGPSKLLAGKARGGGTRTAYFSETPTVLAKSRRLNDPMVINFGDNALWTSIFS